VEALAGDDLREDALSAPRAFGYREAEYRFGFGTTLMDSEGHRDETVGAARRAHEHSDADNPTQTTHSSVRKTAVPR
jgi:hypothetical protein